MHVLYRFFNADGQLLYVGITKNPPTRLRGHQSDKAWWPEIANVSFEYFESREELAAAEVAAIRAENPRYNVAHNLKAPIVRVPERGWDLTDTGHEVVSVRCPYCATEHWHYVGAEMPAPAACGRGRYEIERNP